MKPQPFIDLLILDMINRFIFGHGVLIYYIRVQVSDHLLVYQSMLTLVSSLPVKCISQLVDPSTSLGAQH